MYIKPNERRSFVLTSQHSSLSLAKALNMTYLRMFDRAQYVFTKSYWGNFAGAQVVDIQNSFVEAPVGNPLCINPIRHLSLEVVVDAKWGLHEKPFYFLVYEL